MTRPDHPRLTRWLTDNLYGLDEYTTRDEVAAQMIADSPDIADRLEQALDVCGFPGCPGGPLGDYAHSHGTTHGYVDHDLSVSCHPYVPLVEVPHD